MGASSPQTPDDTAVRSLARLFAKLSIGSENPKGNGDSTEREPVPTPQPGSAGLKKAFPRLNDANFRQCRASFVLPAEEIKISEFKYSRKAIHRRRLQMKFLEGGGKEFLMGDPVRIDG